MADRALARDAEAEKLIATKDVARLESPPATQLRVHPAAADGYRSRQRGGWSTRVFVDPKAAKAAVEAGPVSLSVAVLGDFT